MSGLKRKLARADLDWKIRNLDLAQRREELLQEQASLAKAVDDLVTNEINLEISGVDYVLACDRFEDDGGPPGPRYPAGFLHIATYHRHFRERINAAHRRIESEARRLGLLGPRRGWR